MAGRVCEVFHQFTLALLVFGLLVLIGMSGPAPVARIDFKPGALAPSTHH